MPRCTKFSKNYFRGLSVDRILFLYLFVKMVLNVNKGHAAQDFMIEMIVNTCLDAQGFHRGFSGGPQFSQYCFCISLLKCL